MKHLSSRAFAAAVILLAVALMGCEQQLGLAPTDIDAADIDVQASRSLGVASATRGGSTCSTSGNEVELCSTQAGSSYPDTHDGTKFKVVLKFSEAVVMHLRSVPGIINVRYGAIRNVVAVDATQVPLPYQRPGPHPDWASTQAAAQWEFWVHPAPNRPQVTLTVHAHDCDHRNAICSKDRFKARGSRHHRPLKAGLTIVVVYEDPNPAAAAEHRSSRARPQRGVLRRSRQVGGPGRPWRSVHHGLPRIRGVRRHAVPRGGAHTHAAWRARRSVLRVRGVERRGRRPGGQPLRRRAVRFELTYRVVPGATLHRSQPGGVARWNDGVVFRCPCGHRLVRVDSPPHVIDVADDGRLTLGGSCGYAKNDEHPEGWCHFWIKDGKPEMCPGAQCPGGSQAP